MMFFLVAIAACGALYYSLLTWQRPEMALAIMLAAAPFASLLLVSTGFQLALAEAFLVLTLPLLIARLVAERNDFTVGTLELSIFLYLGVCICASLMSNHVQAAFLALIQTMEYLLGAVLVFSRLLKDPRDLQWGLYGIVFSGVILTIAMFRSNSFYVLGLHKNGIGDSLSCALIVALELLLDRRHSLKAKIFIILVSAVIFAGLIRTLSRGSWAGAIVGIFLVCVIRKRYFLMIKTAVYLAPLLFLLWWFIPSNLQHYALDFNLHSDNIHARLASFEFAYNAFKQNPWLGVGVGLRKEFDATNVVITTLAESGLLGLTAFLAIHVCLLRLVWISRSVYDFSSREFSLMAVGMAFVVNRFVHGLVDHYWTRGASLLAWAGAGMVLAAYHHRPKRASS